MSGRADGVAQARLWLGTPYVHQAATLGSGSDCLGLLRGVWRAVMGPEPEDVPPYTMDWSEAEGREEMPRFWRAMLWCFGCGPVWWPSIWAL